MGGQLIIGRRFIDFKEKQTTLREVVERHFNTVMREISNGLPSINEEIDDDENDYTFDGTNVGKDWTCRTCHVKNPIHNDKCNACHTPKP